ncbi:hypothetical protein D3C85_1263820 [compost metagenome]
MRIKCFLIRLLVNSGKYLIRTRCIRKTKLDKPLRTIDRNNIVGVFNNRDIVFINLRNRVYNQIILKIRIHCYGVRIALTIQRMNKSINQLFRSCFIQVHSYIRFIRNLVDVVQIDLNGCIDHSFRNNTFQYITESFLCFCFRITPDTFELLQIGEIQT